MDKPQIPNSYLLRITTINCVACGHTAHASDFFSVTLVKPRMGHGSPMKHAIACVAPEFDLPIERQFSSRKTPFCAECQSISLSHLPLPPSVAMLYDFAEPVAKAGLRPTKPTPAAKPRLEDLA